jgi:nicotinamidase-related amidase
MSSYVEGFTAPVAMSARTTALVVVDMQYASGSREHGLGALLASQGTLDSAAYRFDRIDALLIPNIGKMLAAFRANGTHIVHVTVGSERSDYSDAPRHMLPFFTATNNHTGTREHEIVDALKPLPGEPVFNKVTMGAFSSTGIGAHLTSKGIREIIVTGVSTNNCVGMTGQEAADRAEHREHHEAAQAGDAEAFAHVALLALDAEQGPEQPHARPERGLSPGPPAPAAPAPAHGPCRS